MRFELFGLNMNRNKWHLFYTYKTKKGAEQAMRTRSTEVYMWKIRDRRDGSVSLYHPD